MQFQYFVGARKPNALAGLRGASGRCSVTRPGLDKHEIKIKRAATNIQTAVKKRSESLLRVLFKCCRVALMLSDTFIMKAVSDAALAEAVS